MNAQPTSRWLQRFSFYQLALARLEEAIQLANQRALSELEKGGLIQRFENAWEMGWKALSDYLRDTEEPGLPDTPGSTIRLAAALRLIEDGDGWLNAGKLRNVLSHECSLERRDEGLTLIKVRFLPLMQQLRERLAKARDAAA